MRLFQAEGGHFLDWRDCTPLDGRHWTRRQPRSDDRTSSQPGSDRDEAIGQKDGHWTPRLSNGHNFWSMDACK